MSWCFYFSFLSLCSYKFKFPLCKSFSIWNWVVIRIGIEDLVEYDYTEEVYDVTQIRGL